MHRVSYKLLKILLIIYYEFINQKQQDILPLPESDAEYVVILNVVYLVIFSLYNCMCVYLIKNIIYFIRSRRTCVCKSS